MIKTDLGGNSQLYTDLAELQKLKSKAKDNDGEGLRLAAEQFEQLFLNMLLKSMRDANSSFGEGNFMNSSQTRFYQEMFDNQLAMEVSSSKGIGLSDVIVRQLSQKAGDNNNLQSEDLKPFDLEANRMNQAFDQAAAMAATALLAKAEGQENPPGLTLSNDQKDTLDALFKAQLEKAETKTDDNIPQSFNSPEEFVDVVMPLARRVSGELGVDPRVLVAQAALETGWGRFMVRDADGANSNNLFNIKADSRWQGESAQVTTLEYRDGLPQKEKAAFRSYANFEDSFRDYVDFLKQSPRYQDALRNAADPHEYVRQLQEAGYATDPNYADKISNIFEGEFLAGNPAGGKEG